MRNAGHRVVTPRSGLVVAAGMTGLLLLGCQRASLTPMAPATTPSPAEVGAQPPARVPTATPRNGTPSGMAITGAAPIRRSVPDIAPPLPREFRGVWVASVANIDWPSSRSLTTAQQQAELVALLDRAVALKLNAVIFQVRPAADALYASAIEPWSEYLTGAQGRRPDPYWDPLEFVVREAHARQLELHAWFNPYRARHADARSPLSATHIARTQPSLVKKYGPYLWMDPGEPAVRERTLRVVLDVVRRYDIDGVHIDDYFYPYPEVTRRKRPIAFPDGVSWARYKKQGGTLSRADWRRDNVNQLVRDLAIGIRRTKPWVRFGISPFGIWRPGFPESVRGFDAYSELYADARTWMREGWGDYFTPQLYWPTTSPRQAYPTLLAWWAQENTLARHLWPGNFTSRAGGRGASAFSVSELLEQIRVTRLQSGATGNVHFSMKSFLDNQGGMNDRLLEGPYAEPALVPATPWLTAPPPPRPAPRLVPGADGWQLTLSNVASRPPGTLERNALWQWVVRLRTDSAWVTIQLPGGTAEWPLPRGLSVTAVTVSSINRIGAESEPITIPVALPTAPSTPPSSAGRGRSDAH